MITKLKQKPYNYGIRRGKPPLDYGFITNCLVDVPQRIKYELTNNVLTIKAGTVCIVPYGTEAPTLSVGDYLLGEDNNNLFKIVDIQYDSTEETPKLIYWCEVQRDISRTNYTFAAGTQYVVNLCLNSTNEAVGHIDYTRVNYVDTTDTAGEKYLTYNTTTNYVSSETGSFTVGSLPLGLIKGSGTGVTSVDTVFNGMGFIGGTLWIDKGCIGLATNGNNIDGSLNNISATTKFVLYTVTTGTDNHNYIMLYDIDTGFLRPADLANVYFETPAVPPSPSIYMTWLDT